MGVPLPSIKVLGACSVGSSLPRLTGERFCQGLLRARGPAIAPAE